MRQQIIRDLALVVAALVYLLALGAFLIGWQTDILKIPITIVGVMLAALIPELMRGKWTFWRVLLLCLPVVGVAAVQIVDARDSANDLAQLRNQLTSSQLGAIRDSIAKCEFLAQESVVPDPRDALDTLAYADRAMQKRIQILTVRDAIYQARVSNSSLSEESRAQARSTLEQIRAEASRYDAAARFFQDTVFKKYSAFRDGRQTGLSGSELQDQMNAAARDLAAFAEEQPSAGLFGRIGMLAIARGEPEEATYFYLRGLMEDRESLSVYESLGHASWALNQDARAGVRYARAGAALVPKIQASFQQEYSDTLSALPAGETETLRRLWTEFEPDWREYLENYELRFALQEVYFNALLLENGPRARAQAEFLIKQDPNDAEYQDAMGFVLMRFAQSSDELAQAESLFRRAIVNPRGEQATTRSANDHLKQVNALMQQIADGAASTAMADLANSCL